MSSARCLTLPEAKARARAAAAAAAAAAEYEYEDDDADGRSDRGVESVRLLNEVISASRMADLFINALLPSPPLSSPLFSSPTAVLRSLLPRSLLRHQPRGF